MDIDAFRRLQDSGWVREQRELIARGRASVCPDPTCGGSLTPFDHEELRSDEGTGIPTPGGVRCTSCGVRSRAVAL